MSRPPTARSARTQSFFDDLARTLAEPMPRCVLAGATQLEPRTLRALDAIHVTTALRARSALAAFVSYDRHQLEAAEALGLPVTSPR